MALTTYFKNDLLDTALSGRYLSLHNGAPGDSGANEVSGGSYSRKAITYAAASGGSKASSVDISFLNMPAVTGLAYVGIWDASSGGNLLWWLSLDETVNTNAGDTFRLPAGALINTLS